MSTQEPVTAEDHDGEDTAEQHKSRTTTKKTKDADRIRYNPSRESDN
jgi:hypothetical protein